MHAWHATVRRLATMKCPYCDDLKTGDFPGIDVRCKACAKRFYAGKNGIGYRSAPWLPWLMALVLPLAGGGVVWGITRFAMVGDYGQVLRILITVIGALVMAECIRRFSTVPEV